MSKIRILPNTSGTGTITLSAPNTNTDRTFTLPDSSGDIITSSSQTILQVVYFFDDTDTVLGTNTWTNLPATIGSITAIGNNSRYLYHSLVCIEADNSAAMFGFLRLRVNINSGGYNPIADSGTYFNAGDNSSAATNTTNYNIVYTSTASAGASLSFQLQARANRSGAHFFQPGLTGYDPSYDVECHGYIMEIAA